MNIQSSHGKASAGKSPFRLQRWFQRHTYNIASRRILRPLGRSVQAEPSVEQMELVLMSLILGFISIFASIFPICGFPIAITGLLIGLYGRHMTSLQSMASWAVVLSLVGFFLTLMNVIVTLSIYFSNYLLP